MMCRTKGVERKEHKESTSWLPLEVLPLFSQVARSLTVYFTGGTCTQRPLLLLLARTTGGFKPLAHLFKSDGIDLTSCIPLMEDV